MLVGVSRVEFLKWKIWKWAIFDVVVLRMLRIMFVGVSHVCIDLLRRKIEVSFAQSWRRLQVFGGNHGVWLGISIQLDPKRI